MGTKMIVIHVCLALGIVAIFGLVFGLHQQSVYDAKCQKIYGQNSKFESGNNCAILKPLKGN